VDIGQSHNCQGVGTNKDAIAFQTETNGNVSMFIIGNKMKLDYESDTQINGMPCL